MYELEELLPHRKPMLLLDEAINVAEKSAEATVTISSAAAFFVQSKGVPSWIGVEYMGQTAALIAGWQLKNGITQPHLGLLLGTRKYTASCAWFAPADRLRITADEVAVVGQGLATFYCEIRHMEQGRLLASAKLSVMRKPLS